MAKLFFLLSGEHETLPVAELKAVLESEGHYYEILERLDQVVRIRANMKCIESLKRRAALTRICGLELISCNAETEDILEAVQNINLSEVLGKKVTFAVRVKRIKDYSLKISSLALERSIGKQLLCNQTCAKVGLENPTVTFFGILTGKRFVFGIKLAELRAKPFVERRPRKKPFFHPSAMQSKLARCMVNLVKPKTGDLIIDPFCGTGSMLIEASLVGCHVLGLDIQRRMTEGTSRNLAHFDIEPEGLVVADVRYLPLTKVDCVVTDPPYGTSSTTLRRTTRQVVKELFTDVHGMLDNGRRICIAAPQTLKIKQVGIALGYKHLESHFVHVHRSLTREIAVFEKV